MFCLHCNSDLLAVDVLWWTVSDSCSAFLARLGGSAGQRALGAPGIRCDMTTLLGCAQIRLVGLQQ